MIKRIVDVELIVWHSIKNIKIVCKLVENRKGVEFLTQGPQNSSLYGATIERRARAKIMGKNRAFGAREMAHVSRRRQNGR